MEYRKNGHRYFMKFTGHYGMGTADKLISDCEKQAMPMVLR